MKTFLIAAAVLLAAIAAAIGLFVATFDVNRYKPEIERRLSQTAGAPVSIGRISLGWNMGIAGEVRKLAVHSRQDPAGKPVVFIERASARVRLLPLVSRRVEIASVLVQGLWLNVLRLADGVMVIKDLPPSSTAGELTYAYHRGPGDLGRLRIDQVRFEDVVLGYADLSAQSPFKITVKDIDARLKDVAIGRPIAFEARAALFAARQNVSFRGRLHADSARGPFLLEDFRFETDLGEWDLRELKASVPAAARAGIRDLDGDLTAGIARLMLASGVVSEAETELLLQDGRIRLDSLPAPMENMSLSAVTTGKDLRVNGLSANFAGGAITASGESKDFFKPAPRVSFEAGLKDLRLEALTPERGPGGARLEGLASASFRGEATGLSWPGLSQTLNGRGVLTVVNPVLRNVNVLRLVFDKLSAIPGVKQTLNTQLPPGYRESLNTPDTPLAPIEVPVEVTNGVMMIRQMRLAAAGCQITAAGSVALAGPVSLEASLILDPTLSRLLVTNAPQLQYIAAPNGLLAFPLRISGDIRHLSVRPDMDYLVSRALAAKGQELITQALQKAVGGDNQKLLSKLFQ